MSILMKPNNAIKVTFKDFRSVETYGKEIYTTNSLEDARRFMKEHSADMKFEVGGGLVKNGEQAEIYWDVVAR